MINVDLQQLIQALDAETRSDLERSAEQCVARGADKVLVEDLMLGLLERPQGCSREPCKMPRSAQVN